MILKKLINVFVLLFIIQNIFAQADIKQIIDKNLKVSGINQNKQINSFRIKAALIQNHEKMNLEMLGILPDNMLMTISFNQMSFTQANNSKLSWKYNSADSSFKTAASEINKAESFVDHWTGGLIKYKSGTTKGKLLGIENIDGVAAYKLALEQAGKTRIYYIDTLSYLLLRVDQPDSEERTYYMNYQKTGDFLLPLKLDGYNKDQLLMSIEMDTVKVNIKIDQNIFEKPNFEK